MKDYMRGFAPYGLAAFLVGAVGGFSAVLGPSFVNDIGIAYNNTTWTALAQAASSAAFAPVLGRLGDAVGRRHGLLAGLGFFTSATCFPPLLLPFLPCLLHVLLWAWEWRR